MTESPFWNQPLTAIEGELQCSPGGLTSEEAERRIHSFGPNRAEELPSRSIMFQFLSRFKSPLVLLLLVASTIMGLTGDMVDCGIVVSIILLSVTLDFVQERQASRAVDALRRSIALRALVVRDGSPAEVAVSTLVPGDVLHLAAGDLIPVDGRILEAKDFFINQAALTGEPYPVEKHAGKLPIPVSDLNEAANAVFAGGSVISGMATILTCRTGGITEFGQIAAALSDQRPPTAFDIGIRRFGLLITRLTALLVIVVLIINWSLQRTLVESVLFSIALAVGLTPELLPMIITVTLSRGAVRMAKKQVIIKQLEAIHNLGSMDVLCTDKTGTLTEATIKVAGSVNCEGAACAPVLSLAYLNSHFETGLKSALDDAILTEGQVDVSAWTKIDEVPFDFERRRVSVLIDNGERRLLVVKGAPEDVLRVADQYGDHGNDRGAPKPMLIESTRTAIQRVHDSLAQQGLRLLGVGFRDVPNTQAHACIDDETGLVFAGFVTFLDPPKQEARQALAALSESGVAVKVISGDNEFVTRHVCETVGLPIRGVLTGAEAAELDDLALGARAELANVFCRVTPQQKSRIIRALKLRGHTVGYLGDGINDAPSLHVADVGISVDSAVDVAKGAAQVVLLKADLNVLHEGVIEGRRTFGNVMKYILMATSSNFGNMFSMAGAALILPFLPMLPVQILLNNLLYDVSELALPFDRVDLQDMERPQHWDMSRILKFMWIIGPVSSIFDFFTFYLLMRPFRVGPTAFHTGWFVESMATQVLVIFVIRTRGNPFKSRCSPWLTMSSLGALLVAVVLPFSPAAVSLGFVPLPPALMVALTVVVIVYLLLVQLVKSTFFQSKSAV